MKVTVTLDNDGRLHVLEQQTMAFTGTRSAAAGSMGHQPAAENFDVMALFFRVLP